MELEDIYERRIKLEDLFFDMKTWEPKSKELKKQLKEEIGVAKRLLKLMRKTEQYLEHDSTNKKYRIPANILGKMADYDYERIKILSTFLTNEEKNI